MARKQTSVIQVMITGDAGDLEKATSKGAGAFGTLAVAAGLAAKAVIGATASIAAASVREFAKFDQAFTQSTAIMGDLSDAMRTDLAEAAREVAKATTFSAEQAAEAIYFLASAGLDAEQSVAALPAVAQFAQAGMFDLARATDILTDAQTALGMNSQNAEENLARMIQISDVLVRANTVANASVEQFGEALMVAGPRMRELGISVEEGTAVLASFASAGFKGQTAGQGLAIILRDLPRAAAKNAEEFAELGIRVEDAQGNFLPMTNIIGQFDRALDGMSATQRAATFDMLGITRTAANMMAMLLGTGGAIGRYEAALRNAGGATEEVADKQLASFTNQLKLIGSGLADVMISIGETLAGEGSPLQRLVTWFRTQIPTIESFVEDRLIPAFENFVREAEANFIEFKGFFEENLREPINEFMGQAREFATEAIQPFQTFLEQFKTFGTDFAAAIEEQDPEAAGQALGRFISQVFSKPFLAAANFGKIFEDLFNAVDWERVGKVIGENAPVFFGALFEEMFSPANREAAKQFVVDNWQDLLIGIFTLGIVRAAFMLPGLILKGLGGIIVGGFRLLVNFLFKRLPVLLLRGAGAIGMALLRFLGIAAEFVVTGVARLITEIAARTAVLIANAIRAIAAWLPGFVGGLAQRFLVAFRGVFRNLGMRLFNVAGVRVGQFFALLARAAGGWVLKVLGSIVAAIGGWPVAIIAALLAALGVFVYRFQQWRDEQETEFANIGQELVMFITQGWLDMWHSATGFISKITGALGAAYEALETWVSDKFEELKSVGRDIVNGIIAGIRGMGAALTAALLARAIAAWEAVKDFFRVSSPSLLFEGLGVNLMQGLANGILQSGMMVNRAMAGISADVAGVTLMPPSVPLTNAGAGPQQTVVNVTVTSADPEAVVQAIRRYTRYNGPLGQVVTL